MIFLTPEARRQPDAYEIDLSKPIMRSPTSVSFYSLSGAKVLEKTVVLDTPAKSITLGDLSEKLSDLPSGYYFYDLQARAPAMTTQQSDSLLFRDISNSHLPTEPSFASFSKFGDLNGDTFDDLVLSRAFAFGQPQVFINDGSGRFVDETADRLPVAEFATSDIELIDVDLDGDLDIFFAAEDTTSVLTESADRLYLNDGAGNFTEVSETHLPVLPVLSMNAAVGFINADAFPDLVVVGITRTSAPFVSSLFVLLNDGAGRFLDQSTGLLPDSLIYGAVDVALGDVDGDERQDIVLANIELTITDETGPDPIAVFSGQNAVLLQNESNEYVDETANRMPVDNEPTKLIRMVDINNDEAPELYAINLSSFTNADHQLYLNDGNGGYENVSSARLPKQNMVFLNDVAFKDFDSNGYVDMYLVNVTLGGPAPDFLNLNSDGFFSDASDRLPARSDFSVSASSADIEHDGDFDIFVSHSDGSLGPAQDLLLENLNVVVSAPEGPEPTPEAFSLLQNYPNPFNPETTIRYDLPQAVEVKLHIYNVMGQKVVTLLHERQPAGQHSVQWDGKSDSGKPAPSGVYIYRLQTEEFVQSDKMLLLR